VVRTRVGYSGGQKANPTYYSMGDHTEALQIDFDPEQISYAELLDIFWKTHNPCETRGRRQYMSAVFYHNDAQKKLIFETRQREAERRGEPIATLVAPAADFYVAEDYHQKHELRHSGLMGEFRRMYPKDTDLTNSTAAARVNGYLGGFGSRLDLEKEIDRYGLSDDAKKALLTEVQRRR
jgi:peptide-methionine (S)-S-oxide reductase